MEIWKEIILVVIVLGSMLMMGEGITGLANFDTGSAILSQSCCEGDSCSPENICPTPKENFKDIGKIALGFTVMFGGLLIFRHYNKVK